MIHSCKDEMMTPLKLHGPSDMEEKRRVVTFTEVLMHRYGKLQCFQDAFMGCILKLWPYN